MKCPRCMKFYLQSKRILGIETNDEIEIDHCAHCSGIWFDAGELNRILRSAKSNLKVPVGAISSNTSCPRCANNLSQLTQKLRSRISVAVLQTTAHDSGGLWLDGGEVREIFMVRHSQGLSRHHNEQAGLFLRWLRAIRSALGIN